MAYRIAAGLLALLLLCGCSDYAMLTEGARDLLQVPTLNKRQGDVSLALQATLNLEDIVYKYPVRGEYRSPFVFHDMDGDGREEALVFYAFAETPGEVRAKVLVQVQEDEWIASYDIPGEGDEVEFVEFASLLQPDTACLLIGWQDSLRRTTQLSVYSMDGAFRLEHTAPCTDYAVADVPGLALSRLLLITRENRDDLFEVVLLGDRDGRLAVQDNLWLSEDAISVINTVQGQLWDNSLGVYVDEVLDNDTVATEVIRVRAGSLDLVAGGQSADQSVPRNVYMETYRPDRVLSEDINGDGVVEIPQTRPLPGVEESDEITPMMLTEYRVVTGEGLDVLYRAAVNGEDGYRVFFPDRWLETVTVQAYPESREWRFYRVEESTGMATVELLRIAVRSGRDYDTAMQTDYIALGTKGVLQYYGYIPRSADPLALREGELETMFSLV